MSQPFSKLCVAKLWRSECGVARFLIPAIQTARSMIRCAVRGLRWRWSLTRRCPLREPMCCSPGKRKSSPANPVDNADSNYSNQTGIVSCRSERPFPCQTLITRRSKSTSRHLTRTTSLTLIPVAYIKPNSSLSRCAGAACSNEIISSGLRITGSFFGLRGTTKPKVTSRRHILSKAVRMAAKWLLTDDDESPASTRYSKYSRTSSRFSRCGGAPNQRSNEMSALR